eukprot:g1549.t1
MQANARGWTVLHVAASLANEHIVTHLVLDCLVAVDVADVDGMTPAMIAASKNAVGAVRFLVNHGAGLGDLNPASRTLLDAALESTSGDVVAYLLGTKRSGDGEWEGFEIARRQLFVGKCDRWRDLLETFPHLAVPVLHSFTIVGHPIRRGFAPESRGLDQGQDHVAVETLAVLFGTLDQVGRESPIGVMLGADEDLRRELLTHPVVRSVVDSKQKAMESIILWEFFRLLLLASLYTWSFVSNDAYSGHLSFYRTDFASGQQFYMWLILAIVRWIVVGLAMIQAGIEYPFLARSMGLSRHRCFGICCCCGLRIPAICLDPHFSSMWLMNVLIIINAILGIYQNAQDVITGIAGCIMWAGCLSYVPYVFPSKSGARPKLGVIVKMIWPMVKDVGRVYIILFAIILSFYCVFYPYIAQRPGFETTNKAWLTLIRGALGDFDWDGLGLDRNVVLTLI